MEHNVAWHKRETCKEYDYRTNKRYKKEEEVLSRKLIEETTKKCPGCNRSIEKSFGCDHMTCKFLSFLLFFRFMGVLVMKGGMV